MEKFIMRDLPCSATLFSSVCIYPQLLKSLNTCIPEDILSRSRFLFDKGDGFGNVDKTEAVRSTCPDLGNLFFFEQSPFLKQIGKQWESRLASEYCQRFQYSSFFFKGFFLHFFHR